MLVIIALIFVIKGNLIMIFEKYEVIVKESNLFHLILGKS